MSSDFNINFEALKEQFPSIELVSDSNSFEKIRVNPDALLGLLNELKNDAMFDYDMLSSLIAVDLGENFELIYDLYSTGINKSVRISIYIDKKMPNVPSAVSVFESAHFDECEIFDMFGMDFKDNRKLKRLFMPETWVGHPLRKDYILEDKRLDWNLEAEL